MEAKNVSAKIFQDCHEATLEPSEMCEPELHLVERHNHEASLASLLKFVYLIPHRTLTKSSNYRAIDFLHYL